ncbi:hypothetical protein MYX82_12545 [Acidobacteria bacterium AH-259-D05]|nr:hypothetical protein [Acidobacteria bacterium AH-259-D05]
MKWIEDGRKRVIDTLRSVEDELLTERILEEQVDVAWDITDEQRRAESYNFHSTLNLAYKDRSLTLKFTSEELQNTENERGRRELQRQLRISLISLARGSKQIGFTR